MFNMDHSNETKIFGGVNVVPEVAKENFKAIAINIMHGVTKA